MRMRINGEEVGLTPENTGVALFWELRDGEDMDYVNYTEGEGDEEHHTLCFSPMMARWMGGLALRAEDQRDLRQAERSNGTFYERSGWHPIVIIEPQASDREEELYIQHISQDLDGIDSYDFGADT